MQPLLTVLTLAVMAASSIHTGCYKGGTSWDNAGEAIEPSTRRVFQFRRQQQQTHRAGRAPRGLHEAGQEKTYCADSKGTKMTFFPPGNVSGCAQDDYQR